MYVCMMGMYESGSELYSILIHGVQHVLNPDMVFLFCSLSYDRSACWSTVPLTPLDFQHMFNKEAPVKPAFSICQVGHIANFTFQTSQIGGNS